MTVRQPHGHGLPPPCPKSAGPRGTEAPPHGTAPLASCHRRPKGVRPGRPRPAASWASSPATAPAAGKGARPGPRPAPRPARRRCAARPGPAPPAGPPDTGKRPGLRAADRPAGPQRHGTAQGAGLAQQQALFRPPGRVQHAHGAPRCPAPKAEGPRTGKICQPGRELPLRRDGLSCRGQGTAHRPGVRPLRQGVVPAHAAGPASFRAISRPMTKAWRQSCGNCSSRRRRLSATEKRSALYLA